MEKKTKKEKTTLVIKFELTLYISHSQSLENVNYYRLPSKYIYLNWLVVFSRTILSVYLVGVEFL